LDLKVILTLTLILTELEAVITYFGIPTLLDSLEACSHKPLVATVERVDVVLDLAWEEVHSWFRLGWMLTRADFRPVQFLEAKETAARTG
jgi:hypothetical protein